MFYKLLQIQHNFFINYTGSCDRLDIIQCSEIIQNVGYLTPTPYQEFSSNSAFKYYISAKAGPYSANGSVYFNSWFNYTVAALYNSNVNPINHLALYTDILFPDYFFAVIKFINVATGNTPVTCQIVQNSQVIYMWQNIQYGMDGWYVSVFPGLFTVQLYHGGQLLISRPFTFNAQYVYSIYAQGLQPKGVDLVVSQDFPGSFNPPTPTPKPKGLGGGAIFGIIVAVLIGVAVIAGASYYAYKSNYFSRGYQVING